MDDVLQTSPTPDEDLSPDNVKRIRERALARKQRQTLTGSENQSIPSRPATEGDSMADNSTNGGEPAVDIDPLAEPTGSPKVISGGAEAIRRALRDALPDRSFGDLGSGSTRVELEIKSATAHSRQLLREKIAGLPREVQDAVLNAQRRSEDENWEDIILRIPDDKIPEMLRRLSDLPNPPKDPESPFNEGPDSTQNFIPLKRVEVGGGAASTIGMSTISASDLFPPGMKMEPLSEPVEPSHSPHNERSPLLDYEIDPPPAGLGNTPPPGADVLTMLRENQPIIPRRKWRSSTIFIAMSLFLLAGGVGGLTYYLYPKYPMFGAGFVGGSGVEALSGEIRDKLNEQTVTSQKLDMNQRTLAGNQAILQQDLKATRDDLAATKRDLEAAKHELAETKKLLPDPETARQEFNKGLSPPLVITPLPKLEPLGKPMS